MVTVLPTGSDAQLSGCGSAPLNTVSETRTRIIGGDAAPAGSWPWQASLHVGARLCGGSLITSRWVLSAAQCFPSSGTPDVTVYLGRSVQQGSNPEEVSRTASRVLRHPGYDERTKENDIALLELDSAVDFSDYVRPVCLAAEDSFFVDGLSSWITGWGDIQTGGVVLPSPQQLQQVRVPIVSNIQCDAVYGSITPRMMCAGPDVRGKGFCEKDYGGPLVTLNGTRWVQAGVVSFARGCGYPRAPGVFTRVSRYRSWISSHVGEEQPDFITVFSRGSRTSPAAVILSVPVLVSVRSLAV